MADAADLTLSWAPAAKEEQVSEYRVYHKIGENWHLIGTPKDTTWSMCDVTSGEHHFRVSAVNCWGESIECRVLSTPPLAHPPGGLAVAIYVSPLTLP